MDLEQNQRLHDLGIQLMASVSASNDYKQIPEDATDVLINGATMAANGKTLGLNLDQTIHLAEMAINEQQQDAFGKINQNPNPLAAEKDSATSAIGNELMRRFKN